MVGEGESELPSIIGLPGIGCKVSEIASICAVLVIYKVETSDVLKDVTRSFSIPLQLYDTLQAKVKI